MNCEHLREILYDYLDDSLSPSGKAAAEKHLAGCPACREAVQRESQLAQSLCRRLEQAVETVALDPVAQRGMATAVERKIAQSRERPLVSFWSRLALPFATAAAILMVAIWMGHHFFAGQNSHLEMARVPAPADNREVLIHVSYSVPGYTFRKEGNLIIDALTCDTLVEDGALLVKN
ncbi:MAG: zf-HC2 domain-containing protein [Verrucomicrobiota bacterium]|jgi:anti-sigma factor RsiW